jgi:hypothetical protein
MSQNQNPPILVIDDDTTLYNIDDALRYLDLAQSKLDDGLDFDYEHEIRQSMMDAEEYLAGMLPGEAIKMIELAKGRISSNYSLRTSFTRILEMMANFCPEQIELLPDYE